MKKIFLAIVVLAASLGFSQTIMQDQNFNQWGLNGAASGAAQKYPDIKGTVTNTFEVKVNGTAPATLTVTILGCMRAGTCSTALAVSSGTSSQILTVSQSVYDYYLVTTSWTGGDATTQILVNRTGTVARIGTVPATSIVGDSGIWAHNSAPLTYIPASTTVTPANNVMQWEVLYPTFPQVIGHATVLVTTGGTADVLTVCLYNSTGSTLLWGASGSVNSTGVVVSLSAPQYTMNPVAGGYVVAWEESGTASAVLQGFGASAPMANILNQNGPRTGTTTNTASGGNCPATTGTLNTATTDVYPLIALEP